MCAAMLGDEFESSDSLIYVRRTESYDASQIIELSDKQTYQMFGRVNVQDVIEKATLAISLCNDSREVVSHAAFFDYPNLSDDSLTADWIDWFTQAGIRTRYRCTAQNTLFLHYFVSLPQFTQSSARQLIKAAFNALPFLHVCVITLPHDVQLGESFKNLFQPVERKISDGCKQQVNVYACYRIDVSGTLLIRDARVEDNDDLAPILKRYTSSLSDKYGDYFLAELIEAQTDSMKCLVAEVDGVAVGFMSISTDVNIELINKCFELYRFNYLLPKNGANALKDKSLTSDSQRSERSGASVIGPNEVFAIQVFCIDEKYEMRSCDFLSFAFAKFEGKKYCVITVPHLVPQFPLLQEFVRITPTISSIFPQEMYLFNVFGLMPGFTVRCLIDDDVSAINNLLESLDSNPYMTDLRKYLNKHRDEAGVGHQMFVALIDHQVVGVAKISQEEDVEYIRSHYDIEQFIYYSQHRRHEHARLHYFILHPIFKHLSRHFLKEILRVGGKSCLYHRVYPRSLPQEVGQVTCLEHLVPVRARRQIIYPDDLLSQRYISHRITTKYEPFALNLTTRKLVLESKVTINARIVVVGASDVGISFLETFAFCPHIRFNNLTLISPHGLPGDHDKLPTRMIAQSLCYTAEEHDKMSLRTWINVVRSKVTGIDRHKKLLRLDDGCIVVYDYLVLCSGTQYQKPPLPSKAVTSSSLSAQPSRNLFTLNDDEDVSHLTHWISKHPPQGNDKVIVYGNNLDAHCCVQGLLTHGLDSNQVVLVTPINESKIHVFNDVNIEQLYVTALAKTGVQLHSGCELIDWVESQHDSSIIKRASFKSTEGTFSIDCAALICFNNKDVDRDLFEAMNCACLVYDGRLVINSQFLTNDSCIRAAGPLTKYQRSYYAADISHALYNSKEVGVQLAMSMMSIFDPQISEPQPTAENDKKILPVFSGPKVSAGFIADSSYYMHVEKPKGLDRLYSTEYGARPTGQDLVTGLPGASSNYFRIHIDQFGVIDSLTCFSSTEFPASNLLCLYGLHEKFLNNLIQRYEEGLIHDFYRYFEEPWVMAVFHDRFHTFCEEMRESLGSYAVDDGVSLEEKVRRMMSNELTVNNAGRKMLVDVYNRHGYRQNIEKQLFGYLTYNSYHLPMYSRPAMI